LHAETCLLQFSVRNTGIGIAPEKLEAIFERFAQADASITRKYGGSGLGLAISRRLVELMGGRIWVDSRAGQGSTFAFTARLGMQPKPTRRMPSLPVDLQGMRVLIIDDNATNRFILKEMLADHGVSVSEAADGAQGLAALQRAREAGVPYQLLLLDCRMPGVKRRFIGHVQKACRSSSECSHPS
jgi:hypothetical protein